MPLIKYSEEGRFYFQNIEKYFDSENQVFKKDTPTDIKEKLESYRKKLDRLQKMSFQVMDK